VGEIDIKGVLFDLDGTLLDTLADLADSMNFVLQRHRLPVHPVAAYRYFVGDGVDMLIRRAVPDSLHDEKKITRITADFQKRYLTNWKMKTAPYAGIDAMFDALQARNLFLSVLSNKPHPITTEVVRHFFGSRHFTACIGNGIFPKKPDCSAALYIASSMGIAPAQCLYVGDTATDMQTAAGAGMPSAGVLWGFREENELRENGARWIISTPAEIPEIIENGVLAT
jgi:phosphoglycolate phosphatase